MSTFSMAKRQNGVCEGSLQKSITTSGMKKTDRSSSSSSNGISNIFSSLSFGNRNSSSVTATSVASPNLLPPPDAKTTVSTYSFLIGVKLVCYESTTAMLNGDHALAYYGLVGVSPCSDDPTAFRVVTDKGTHLLCKAPTKSCREVWLSALNAGLEYQLLQKAETIPKVRGKMPGGGSATYSNDKTISRDFVLEPVRPKFPPGVKYQPAPMKYCRACGDVEIDKTTGSPQYDLAPLPQYGSEERVDLCSKCDLAQGVLEHCYLMEDLYATHRQEQDAMLDARRLVLKKLANLTPKKQQTSTNSLEVERILFFQTSDTSKSTTDGNGGSNSAAAAATAKTITTTTTTTILDTDRDATGRLLPKAHTVEISPMSHHVLGLTLDSGKGIALQRLSPTLRSLCVEFQQGMIGVLEFLELLEAAIGIRNPDMADLKKQAFRVAGDMGTALKLLYEQCLPVSATNISTDLTGGSNNFVSTELLQCILEFFLDLVTEEDELNTLAFFWPQISNIHLQMLPPKDTLSLQKIELLEDFLLTVASRYSIHLAIELVWTHTADLEDALSGSYKDSTTTFCGRRKSAVLRFLCELESLLFDFEGGWGGGSVTVGRFMTPSNHQVDLLRSSMSRIQKCRLAAEHDRLSRSHRLSKLHQHREQKVTRGTAGGTGSLSPEILAIEATRVAKNADYLSTHLVFTKRLCDIAEKLRFLPLNERKTSLAVELSKLNASGSMGGDPTNVIKENDEGHTRVVRLPVMEGHVFRSKARTPVLLLVETMEEAVGVSDSAEEKTYFQSMPKRVGESKPNDEGSESKDASLNANVSDGKEDSNVPENPEATPAKSNDSQGEDSKETPSNIKAEMEEGKESKEAPPNDDAESNTQLNENGKSIEETVQNPQNHESTPTKMKEPEVTEAKEALPSVEAETEEGEVSEETLSKDELETNTEGNEKGEESVQNPLSDDMDAEENIAASSLSNKNACDNKPVDESKDIAKESTENLTSQSYVGQTASQPETQPEKGVVGDDGDKKNIERVETQEDSLNLSMDLIATPCDPSSAMATPQSNTRKTPEARRVGFDDVLMPHLDTATRTTRVGSTDSSHHEKLGLPRHALRRFHSPTTAPEIVTPQADKQLVEDLMTGVLAKQLHIPSLPDVAVAETEKTTDNENKELSMVRSESSIGKPEKQQQQQSSSTPQYSKIKNLRSVNNNVEQSNGLSKTGGMRREVLTAIMTKGMSGSHEIAEKAATGAKRHLQDLERRVAVEALLTGGDVMSIQSDGSSSDNKDDSRKELLTLGIRSAITEDATAKGPKNEDDRTMEAIRLLLIQYRTAKATEACELDTPKGIGETDQHRTIMHNGQEFPEIEAGAVDPRLVGCGVLPPAVLQALTLWKGEMISQGELLELVKKDLEFEKQLKEVEKHTSKLQEDSAFWGRFAFGERWAEKRSRIAASSPDACNPGWDLTGIIVKSNDDLRQEAFVMQLIELCHEAFQEAELELWLLPYRIISTGRSTGIMGLIRNSMSFDGLKKRPGYDANGGIRAHLQRMTEHEADPSEAFRLAQKNFVRSLAAYSLLSYMFLFKDRHNGNIMLDTDGHVIHIDFGFVFGIAPGGNFSLEMTTPFKLTDEMIEVMDGMQSSLFSEFVVLFCCGFLALQAHYTTFVTLVEVTSRGSTFPCFDGRDTSEIIQKMEERFCPDLSQEDSVAHVLDIIKEAVGSYGTKQYDYFQYMSQGIAT